MIAEELRIEMLKRKMTIKQIAANLGKTQNNLSQQLNRANLRENDIKEILDAMNCYLVFDIKSRGDKRDIEDSKREKNETIRRIEI